MKRNYQILVILLLGSTLLAGCFGKKKASQPQAGSSAEPDKVLYERALEDIRKGRHGVGRLTLQTLINTYPDSEYLAEAKLSIADSYYKEGGSAGLTQAVAEYNDFITFFPFHEKAAYAQVQIGMAHFRRMEKPDRDRTQGRLAEDAFQKFLEKYRDSPLYPQAEQRLREVQEVLAEGDYRIARYYYIKGSMRASAARLIELTSRYPLYSLADRANWMLGNIFDRSEKGEIAAQYYSRIVREFPLSGLVEDAKAKLVKLGVPVPQPNPEALARTQRELDLERTRPGVLKRSLGMFRSGPDVSRAAHSGAPNLTPPSETTAGIQPISPGGKTEVAAGSASSGGSTTYVERVTAGSEATSVPPTNATPAGSATAGTENPPKPDSPAADAKTAADAAKPADKDKDGAKPKKESTSKKKKGLRKIIPW